MKKKRVLSLILALAVFFSTVFTVGPSFADEKMPKSEDFEIIPVEGEYDSFTHFSEGLAAVTKNGKYGYIDATGRLVIAPEYDMSYSFFSGLAPVEKVVNERRMAGLINKRGELVLPLEYSEIRLWHKYEKGNSEHLYLCFKSSGEWVLVNQELKIIATSGYLGIIDLGEDRILLEREGKKFLLDIKGNQIAELNYENVSRYSEGYALVTKNGKQGFIDKEGKLVISPSEGFKSHFSEGLSLVKEGENHYFIDKAGQTVLDLGAKYEDVQPFYGDLAVVRSNHKAGLIDKTGTLVIPCIYAECYRAPGNSISWVSMKMRGLGFDSIFGLIDKSGKQLLPFEFSIQDVRGFQDGVMKVGGKNKAGFINENGGVILPNWYLYVSDFKSGVAWVTKEKNGSYYLIDKKGQKVINESFDRVGMNSHDRLHPNGAPEEPFSDGLGIASKKDENGRQQLFVIRDKRYFTTKPQTVDKGHVYDEADKGEGLVLPTDELAAVKDKGTATEAVNKALAGATEEQKSSATGTDLLTLYGEEAALRAAKTEVEGSEFVIDKVTVEKVENAAIEAKSAVEAALKDGGVTVQRKLSSGVIYKVKEGAKLSVKVDASSAEAKADNVRVETPTYSLSFNEKAFVSIKEESAEPLEITVTELPAEKAAFPRLMGTHIPTKAVGANLFEDAASKIFDIKFSKKITEKVKLSLPVIKGNPKYQAVYDSTGKAIGGKYNPVTKKLDVKINRSDKYVVKEKKKSFADISSKSKEMQDAIEILASKGIISGTSADQFSPDGAITRAEISALILRSISKLNPSENGGFSDVASTDWYFGAVGSAKRHGIMNGVSKTHFAPKKSILKEQIVAVAARVLKEEMNYSAPAGPDALLSAYTDAATIPNWAKSDVALATREGLVVKRYDSAFIPAGTMTRGDVAVILHRLFKKLW